MSILPLRRRSPSSARRALGAALALGAVLSALPARAGDEDRAPTETKEPQPKPPTVSLGHARMVHGGGAPKGVDMAFAAIGPALDGCYKEAIDAGHEGDATIELRLELVGPGRVASAVINASTDASSKLRGCVRDAFAGAPAGGVGPAPAEVLVSIGFAREAPDDLVLAPSSCPTICDGEMTDELLKEIRARAARAGHCFKRGPAAGEKAGPLQAGKIQVGVRVSGNGGVCGVSSGDDAFGRASLTSCIVETMSEPFTNAPSGCIDVSIPLVFKGN